MKLNNKGFALTSIIYMLIVLFLMILLLILANLAQRKVVLDKIKNDVKINLNQGGLLAKNSYTVTFDPTIGQINQTSKQVTYNEPYGELPTPTREGYKFIGWRCKNMLNMQEWLDSFNSATNGTITKNENSITLTATANDAYIAPTYRKSVEPNKTYTLSWKSNDSSTDGLVYVFIDDKQTSGYMFNANDKNTKSLNFTTPSDATYMSFRVGVSTTGNSKTYFDIQLEEGDTATPYEPYQEYTNDTIVTREENHTLYAMWTEVPKLTLSKETYVDVPFDNTWTYSNATVEDNVLTLGADGNNATATTDFINVNNDFWYVTMDGYTEVTLPDKDKNGIHFTMHYYDSNKSATNALSGANSNGSAINLELGGWKENLAYKFPEYNRYGPNVNYVKLEFKSSDTSSYSKAPIKIRNLKVHGQMPNSFYLINVQATDNDGIDIIKCAKGIQNLEYFKENGTIVENNQARVTENGTYTIYVRDTKGGENIETIEITNIE